MVSYQIEKILQSFEHDLAFERVPFDNRHTSFQQIANSGVDQCPSAPPIPRMEIAMFGIGGSFMR